MRSTLAIVANPGAHQHQGGELYFAVPLERVEHVRPLRVNLWPFRDIEMTDAQRERRRREVRWIGPGWLEVHGPIAAAAGKVLEAAVCRCKECRGRVYVYTRKATGRQPTSHSMIWIKVMDER